MNVSFKPLSIFVLITLTSMCEGGLPIFDAIVSGVQKTRSDIHNTAHKIIDTLRPNTDISFNFGTSFNINRGQHVYGPPNQPEYGVPPVPPQQQPNYEPQNNNRPNIPDQNGYYYNKPNEQLNDNYNKPNYPHMVQNNGNANLNDNQVPTNQNKNEYYDKNAHYQEDTSKPKQETNQSQIEAVLDNIFGNKKLDDNNNKSEHHDDKNKDDEPLFVPLNPKRETAETHDQVKNDDEEFPIDIRFKQE
ncbi:probable serine/threonine-protein kinase clkA [Achroia grisella]|uniref:probable serine/threonine-protein kinase clkA n=1 Tax=Achroia grisella TaxID=688607 RepID=UPI0027D2FB6F|nr:probable serine/threonine-protein kinase clkA [Achroia grisella]